MTKNKSEKLLNELKRCKVKTILVLEYMKRNDRKTFYSSVKLIASGSDIDKAFISTYHSIMIKINNYDGKDWIVLDVIIKQIIEIFECLYKEKKWG